MTHFFPHLLRSILPGFFCLIFSQQILTANTHPADSLKRFSDSLSIDRTPLCTDPTGVAAFWIDSQKILRVVWTDFSAASNYTRYRLRYKLTSVSPYVYSMVYSGRGIDRDLSGVTTTKPVNIALQKICDGTMDHWTIESGWVEVTATDINMDSTDFCGLLQESIATNNTSNVEINVDVKSTKPSLPAGLSYGYRVKKCSDGSWVGPYTFTGESCTVPTGYISPSNACAVELNIYNGGTAMCNPLEIKLDEAVNIEPCSASNPSSSGEYLTTLPVSTVVFVNGIPVTVAEVTGSSGEYFTGSGMAIIPVKSATLAVNFNSIRVDAKTQLVTEGTFTGINSSTRSIPTVAPVTATICIPPPPADSLGLDENGFGPDGAYGVDPPYEGYAPPMDFDPGRDPRGFDVNGYHVNTGTKYDEFGCNQQGLDSLGQHCDSSIYNKPYYWMNPDETEDGQAFVIKYGGDIKRLIIEYLNDLYDRYADSVSAQTTLCSGFRTTINSNLTTLGLDDPTLVKGTADVYVADGMSKKFVSTPVPLANSSPDRNAAAVTMEQAHVDLYHCDKKLELLKHIKTWADNFRTTDSTEIYEYIFGILKTKSKEELDTFIANVNKLNLFIEQSANNLINSKVLNDVGSVEEKTLDVESAKKVFEDLFDKKYKTRVHGGVCSVESYRKDLIPAGARAIPADLAGHFYFSPPDAACQPLEVVGESGGIVNTLLITNVRMSPGSCLFDVYMVMRVPSSGKDILFKALDVGFNGAGPTAGSLGLGSDIEIRMTNAMKLILKEGTAVNFDCHGFKDVTVVAEIAVCREYLTPLDENNKPKPDSVLVKGYIDQITIKNWSNFFADISFDKFCVTDYPQYNFQVTNAEFDFSDFQSPSNVAVPAGYASPFYSNGNFAPAWRGVYIKNITVGYASDTASTSITVAANNMIFDGMGFSGDLMVAVNQASLENNLMGGWPMSIDTIQMGFVANHLVSGGFSGQIVMSIACKNANDNDLQKNALRYKAAIAKGGDFLFSVTTTKQLEVGVWAAHMTLKRMQVTAKKVGSDFTFVANMDGDMRVGAIDSSKFGKSFGASFTNLIVSNKSPYLTAGTWNFDKVNLGFSFKGFGIQINDPFFRPGDEGEIILGINIGIALTSSVSDDNSSKGLDIGAKGRLLFTGELSHPPNGRQRWLIKSVGLDSIGINADIKECFKVKGTLVFKDNDPIYGDGFYGNVIMTLSKMDFKVESAATFGKVNGYKYFFVDAFVNLPKSMAIPIGFMEIRGLGGGLFFNMIREDSLTVLPSTANAAGFGVSLSGVTYKPQKGKMEFKAAALLTTKSSEEALAVNAELSFQFTVGSSNISLDKIEFLGNARFFTPFKVDLPITKYTGMPPLNGAKFVADFKVSIDINRKTLHGDMIAYLDAGFISGVNADKSLGQISFHVEPKGPNNYIYVGTPFKPFGAKATILGGEVKVQLYFDIGNPLPQGVIDIPSWAKDLIKENSSVFASSPKGGGVKFGFQLDIHNEFDWFVVGGHFGLLLGLDMELKKNLDNNGDIIRCSNNNNEKIGFDGWYMRGRAYLALSGSLWVGIGKNFKFDVGSFSIGGILQAAGPNPFYGSLHCVAKYKFLGRGRSKEFEATVGKLCITNQTVDMTPMDIISSTIPSANEPDVKITSDILVNFSLPCNGTTVDGLTDQNGAEFSLKGSIKSYSLKTKAGINIPVEEPKFNTEGDVAIFTPLYLPPLDTVEFTIQTELITSNSSSPEVYTRVVRFFTDSYENVTIQDVIESSIPQNGCNAYYRMDNNQKGRIKLKKNLGNYVFMPVDQEGYEFIVLLSDKDGNYKQLSYEYDASTSELLFGLPGGLLQNNKIYKLEFLRVKSDGAFTESNPSVKATTVSAGNLPHYVANPIMANNPVDNLPEMPTKWNHTVYFRVSGYDRMMEKISDIFNSLPNEAAGDGTIWTSATNIGEPFFVGENIRTKVRFATENQTVVDFNKILSYQSYITSSCQNDIWTMEHSYVQFSDQRLTIDEKSFYDPSLVNNSIYHASEVTTYYLWDALRVVNFYRNGYKLLPPSSQCYNTVYYSIGSMLNGNPLLADPSPILEIPLEITVKYNNAEYKKTFNLNN